MKKLFSLLLIVSIAGYAVVSCEKSTTPSDAPENTKIVAWAVGAMDTNNVGVILYTDDAGETWSRQGDTAMFLGVDINNVWAIDQSNAWIVCSGNKIFRTINGGVTWIPVITPAIQGPPSLYGISVVGNTEIWISGSSGTVYKSVDAGNNWTVYDTNSFRRGLIQGICAITSDIIYVAGEFATGQGPWGFIARTLNGGTTWDSISLPGGFNQYRWIGVTATDSNNIVVYGSTGHYAVTHNGGNFWYTPGQVDPGDINDLVMISSESYWGAFDYDMIFKTFDGGETWLEQTSKGPLNQFLVGIDTYYTQRALIVGESADSTRSGKIINTTDGGNNWSLRHVSPAKLQKVSFAKIQQ
ncbi:MAG: hypothetical protein IH596_11340 [Bacteroidales bacterium]|nr:hypothetical protein [Bacteroidales bacterium]